MLEECIGKEHFDKLAMKMGSMLEDCMKKSPQDYLMGKIDISQIVFHTGHSVPPRSVISLAILFFEL